MKVAIVGAGWAGLACAIEATHRGHAVTLFEAARTLGGRARALPALLPDGRPVTLDNGQHILIGAYAATLALMRTLGVDPEAVLLRLPLALRFPDGGGLQLPRWRPPFDLLAGIACAHGWSWREKASLLRTAIGWRADGFRCAPDATVAALCGSLAPRVVRELVEPLCVAALNTPIGRASGQVFLRVLHDAMFAERGGADLLLPRGDLGALLPEPAGRWLGARGAAIRTGARVHTVARTASQWEVDGEPFDRALLACPPWEAARLAAGTGRDDALAWSHTAGALQHEGIATVYAMSDTPLAAPLLALRAGADAPAQFVFDRGHTGGPAGLLAFVVSTSNAERDTTQRQVLAQAREQLGLAGLQPVRTVVERRASFACTPALPRPGMQVAPGLLACGDYIEGPYPSTLEGAVRSAIAAAHAL